MWATIKFFYYVLESVVLSYYPIIIIVGGILYMIKKKIYDKRKYKARHEKKKSIQKIRRVKVN